jgi:RNA polymerase sigma-70 factor (ECF subfamily)
MSVVDELTPLARAAARGDRAALTRLIRATQGDVWRLCAHLVNPAAADDLARETYLRAVSALRGFRGDAPVRSWLLTIARTVCATEIRSRPRDREPAAGLAAGTPAAQPECRQRGDMVVLSALDPDRRAAFVLTQVLGCSYAETAEICGVPVGIIRSQVARARADLDEILAADGTCRSPARPGGATLGLCPLSRDGNARRQQRHHRRGPIAYANTPTRAP